MGRPRRVGIVGCGTLARTNYAKSLPRVPGIVVTAVHDRDPGAAKLVGRLFGAAVRSLGDLCSEVDAAIVATPPGTHYELTHTCLDHDLLVVCEKPFVGRLEEARTLVSLAEANGGTLFVGHLRRTFETARLARNLIATGALGVVRGISMVEGGRFSWEPQSGYVSADPFGGVLFDTGSHTIDLGLYVTGLDAREFAVEVQHVQRDRPEPAHEIRAELRLDLGPSVVPAVVHLSRYKALANRVRVELDGGTLDIPVGPRDRIRLTGSTGSCLLATGAAPADHDDYFVEQWRQIFLAEGSDMFRARNFLGLTAILEAVSRAS